MDHTEGAPSCMPPPNFRMRQNLEQKSRIRETPTLSTEDKSRNLFKFVSVLLSASVERVGASRMQDFFLLFKLDGVGPVDNRPSTEYLHHFVIIIIIYFFYLKKLNKK